MSWSARTTLRALSLTLLLATVLVAVPIFAQTSDPSYGLNKTATEAKLNVSQNLNQVIGGIIKTTLSIAAILFMITILGAGQMWLASEGNEEKIEKARGIIFNAAVGFMITFGAYLGTDFILNAVFSAVGIGSK
ncbi:MAG: hypothetical protein WC817_01520 [Patescibacteria group bacterium]|jgi:hypothetical protein